METKKRILKTKKFWLIAGAVVLVMIACAALMFVKSIQNKAAAVEALAIQETTAQKGTISETIEGSGTLQAADTEDVMIPSNLVASEIVVSAGDAVEKGDVLAYIDDDSILDALVSVESQLKSVKSTISAGGLSTYEKEQLTKQKKELQNVLEDLEALREDPVIKATVSGTVGSVSISTSNSSSAISSSGSSNSSTQSSGSVMSMSSTQGSDSNKSSRTTAQTVQGSSASSTRTTAVMTTTSAVTPVSEGGEEDTRQTITDFSGIKSAGVKAAKTGDNAAASNLDKAATSNGYTVSASWKTTDGSFAAGTDYTVQIALEADSTHKFDSSSVDKLVEYLEANYQYKSAASESGDESKLVFSITFTTEEDSSSQGGSQQEPSGNNSQNAGDQNTADQNATGQNVTGQNAAGQNTVDQSAATPAANGAADATASAAGASSTGSFSMTGSGSSSGGVSVSSASSSSSGTASGGYETSAVTINKSENVLVSITVSELDILSVAVGQKAAVTVDAISDQEFEGEITRVSNVSSGSGGSAKYTVEITIPQDENMRIGMSATTVITVSEASDVLTIPMNALQQRGNQTFVYTSKDDDGNLSGEVMVETGLSNGSTVEITSGLSEGDTVYYRKSDSSSENGFDFSSMGGFGGGNMPSGDFSGFDSSNMPSGDFGGGSMPSGMPSGGPGGN